MKDRTANRLSAALHIAGIVLASIGGIALAFVMADMTAVVLGIE